MKTRRRTFTLIELLVVVAIIAVLIAVLLPALASARHRTKALICQANLKQLGHATMQYAADNTDHLPPVPWTAAAWGQPETNQSYWVDRLIPYISRSLEAEATPGRVVSVFRCPYDGTTASWGRRSSYMVYPELARRGWLLSAFRQPYRTTYMSEVTASWHAGGAYTQALHFLYLDWHVKLAVGPEIWGWYWD